jgi:hypothetical protein
MLFLGLWRQFRCHKLRRIENMKAKSLLNGKHWRRWVECQVSRDTPTSLPLQQLLFTLCIDLYLTNTLVRFAARSLLIWPRCTPGENLDGLPDDAKELSFYSAGAGIPEYAKKRLQQELTERGITSLERCPVDPDRFSFRFADGFILPGWHFHHIYDGTSPLGRGKKTLSARHHGLHFTQTAGMVAIHPIVEALYDYFPCIKRTLRARSFKKFEYDPDGISRIVNTTIAGSRFVIHSTKMMVSTRSLTSLIRFRYDGRLAKRSRVVWHYGPHRKRTFAFNRFVLNSKRSTDFAVERPPVAECLLFV